MFAITWWHFHVHGRIPDPPRTSPVFPWFRLIELFFLTSVNGMIAISGYFGPTSRGLNLRRLFCLWLSIVFYTAVQTAFSSWMGWIQYNFQYKLKFLTPILHNEYWFLTEYFGVMLVSPALNGAARILSNSRYLAVLFTLFVIEINARRIGRFMGLGAGYEAVHLGIVYFAAGYFRVHGNPFRWRVGAWVYLAFSAYVLDYARYNPIAWLFPGKWGIVAPGFVVRQGQHSGVLQLQLTVALVLVWSTIPVRGGLGTVASFAGAHAFAVYILHDSNLMRPRIFGYFFRTGEFSAPPEAAFRHRMRFVFVVMLFAFACDSYRAWGFDRLGESEVKTRFWLGSMWDRLLQAVRRAIVPESTESLSIVS
jgi:hypothetical protein